MNNEKANAFELKTDKLTLEIMGPLRLSKTLNNEALAKLIALLEEVRPLLESNEQVPRTLTGKLWYVFCAMLAEADHAKNPEPILNAAWKIQEKLRLVFGPHF